MLLSWVNLCFYLQQTFLGTYVIMVGSVGRSFLNFFPILFIILLGFAFSFFVLLQNHVSEVHLNTQVKMKCN